MLRAVAAVLAECGVRIDSQQVEGAELPGRVAMRDSKDPAGPVLAFTRAEWRAFLGGIRASEFS